MIGTSLLSEMDFGNETADDANISELLGYFVEQPGFNSFVQPKERLQVATAKKGAGKSALICWSSHIIQNREPDALVVRCRGAELSGIRTPLEANLKTPNDHIRNWMIKICALMNRHLASRLQIALTDDAITLVEAAEIDGFKSKNLIGSLVDRFNSLLPNKGISKKKAPNEIALFLRSKKPHLWLLIDDLDATFQNTNQENLELGTFFSACRYLAQDINDVYFRVTMRTDVWAAVRRFDESLDKVEQYVREIRWSLSEFRKLLFLRIQSQCLEHGLCVKTHGSTTEERIHQRYFDIVFVPRMTWGEKEQQTYRVLYTLAYERPRWAVQLCKLAQESALEDGKSLIGKDHIDEVWGEYGAKRIKDLVAEHKHQCPQVEELLNAFRGCDRLLNRQELFTWIRNRILNHMNPFIDGEMARSPRVVGHFLYRIGFVLARSDTNSTRYEHYHYDEMPDFLTARTDEDFGVKWEIHPCYREALDIKKLDQSHRRGFRKRRKRQ